MHTTALELVNELLDKWNDTKDSSDDWTEINNALEVIDDLRDIKRELLDG